MSRNAPIQHRFRSADGMVWHFLRPEDWETLKSDPASLTRDGVPVKRSGGRTVCKKDGFFVKTQFAPAARAAFSLRGFRDQLFPRLGSEWRSLLALRAAGVPAVEPVAWGHRDGAVSMLITREMSGTVTANDFYHLAIGRDGRRCPSFFTGWARFVRDMLASGFDHPDFHNGNVLYREEDETFALVDGYGVRRRLFPRRRQMAMIVGEFAEFLSKRELIALIVACGIAQAETFYRATLQHVARVIRHEWPRREKQFFADYPKFVAVEGERRWTLSGARERLPLDGAERVELAPEAARAWRRHDFLLALFGLPRLRAVAFDPPGTLYREVPSGEASPEGVADLRERLALCGLNPDAYGFAADRFGRAVLCPPDDVSRACR